MFTLEWISRPDDLGEPYFITGPNTYTKRAVQSIKDQMTKDGISFNTKPSQPFSHTSYRAELDTSSLCDVTSSIYYIQLIGILRWLCELGRADILYETSILSRYCVQPHTGHLHQLLHVFHYLDKHDSSWLPIDKRTLNIQWNGENGPSPWNRAQFMKEIYPDTKEGIPQDKPESSVTTNW